MRRKDVFLLLSVLMLWCGAHGVQAQDTGDILNRINTLRAQRGLPPYAVNGALTAAAQQQAQWIVDNGSVVHTHPDGSGPRTRALANGYGSPDVSENIYGGTMATTNDAWIFWLNSPIHYQGMVNSYYTEIGVGIASGAWGQAFVTDFGNPTGQRSIQVVSNATGKGSSAAAAAAAPPSYIVGIDEHGNLKHQVHQGETVGDIALLYGYTWADLPYMLQINGLSDVRDLSADSIFLVPPKAGTYTPTPGGPPEATEAATEEAIETGDEPTARPTQTPDPTETPTPIPSPTPLRIATAGAAPQELLMEPATEPATEGTLVAAVPTLPGGTPGIGTAPLAAVTIIRSGPSPWLAVAVAVQVGVLLAAGFEFFRRRGKRR